MCIIIVCNYFGIWAELAVSQYVFTYLHNYVLTTYVTLYVITYACRYVSTCVMYMCVCKYL